MIRLWIGWIFNLAALRAWVWRWMEVHVLLQNFSLNFAARLELKGDSDLLYLVFLCKMMRCVLKQGSSFCWHLVFAHREIHGSRLYGSRYSEITLKGAFPPLPAAALVILYLELKLLLIPRVVHLLELSGSFLNGEKQLGPVQSWRMPCFLLQVLCCRHLISH